MFFFIYFFSGYLELYAFFPTKSIGLFDEKYLKKLDFKRFYKISSKEFSVVQDIVKFL